ncbi:GntR family transcriptional regulator [Paracoccus cavernae]|uniref:GntR family transcriptional regulator n=1 Tax=Paracoccus cavernae TaxID=1571207 RepID=UPI00363A4E3D
MKNDDTSPLKPERSPSLTNQVYGILAEMLLSGHLLPDERMSMRDLADQLGVSVMPVREAVSRLVASGALEVRPNRAVAVPLMTRAGFRDLAETRVHNETRATRLAAQRMSVAELDELRALERAFQQSLASEDSRDAVRANKALHFHIYDAAGSPTLRELIENMWLKAGPVINLDLGHASRRSRNATSVHHHALLVDAIARRDIEGLLRRWTPTSPRPPISSCRATCCATEPSRPEIFAQDPISEEKWIFNFRAIASSLQPARTESVAPLSRPFWPKAPASRPAISTPRAFRPFPRACFRPASM